MKLTKNAKTVLEKRYLIKDENGKIIETPEELFRRVAKKVASAEKNYGLTDEQISVWEEKFYDIMTNLYMIPNTPCLINFGRPNVMQQGSACFVIPVEDSLDAIYDAIKWSALIHKTGGGVGHSFAKLRPKGANISNGASTSTGPIEFMKVFNASTEAVKQGASGRRGANMAILPIDHPDVEEFINLKNDLTQMNNFNISVAITDAFMMALRGDKEYNLIDPVTGKPYKIDGKIQTRSAKDIMRKIAMSSTAFGEPGVVFIDRVNKTNPVLEQKILSSNPCSEQFLPDFDSCTLASIDVGKFIDGSQTDWDKLSDAVATSVRFLDNVLDINEYPLEQITKQTLSNRRIGLGIMGFADYLVRLGIQYNSKDGFEAGAELMKFIQKIAIETSVKIASEKGNFPNWGKSVFKTPMRNATVTTVAPTGSISIIAGCSGGLEPYYGICFERNQAGVKMLDTNPLFEEVAKKRGFYSEELMKKIANEGSIQNIKEIPQDIKDIFVVASDIKPADHVRMQSEFQKYVCNAISKTINFNNSATVDDIEQAYIEAYDSGCKSVAVYRDGCRDNQVLSIGKTKKKQESPSVVKRPDVVQGLTYKIQTSFGKLYMTINSDGNIPIEVFFSMADISNDMSSLLSALGRTISVSLKHGTPLKDIVKTLRKIKVGTVVYYNGKMFKSVPQLVAGVLEEVFMGKDSPATLVSLCDKCGSQLIIQEGCEKCSNPECGYTKCG